MYHRMIFFFCELDDMSVYGNIRDHFACTYLQNPNCPDESFMNDDRSLLFLGANSTS